MSDCFEMAELSINYRDDTNSTPALTLNLASCKIGGAQNRENVLFLNIRGTSSGSSMKCK